MATQSWADWLGGETYRQAWKSVIRPHRSVYRTSDLGPTRFKLLGKHYERQDLQLRNGRGHILECSHFVPTGYLKDGGGRRKPPCVVFLHGNSSCRLEALELLAPLLPLGVTIFCMDFSGSGISGGDYVSLGHQEERDVAEVLRHLRRSGVTAVGLWARSMGAATAVLRAAKDHSLAACVLDSPFRDLRGLAQEQINQHVSLPQLLVDAALEVVRSEVQTRAGFDPDALRPVRAAPKARCPALFAAARQDTLTLPQHVRDVHDAWGGPRHFCSLGGGHNSRREASFMQEAACFLAERLHYQVGSLQGLTLGVEDPSSIAKVGVKYRVAGKVSRIVTRVGALRAAQNQKSQQSARRLQLMPAAAAAARQ
jgi:pimeloyl-ACP methyl ester carboxylesterase